MSKEQDELVAKVKALMVRKYGASDAAAMRKLFDEVDADGDGKIDPHELEGLLKDAGVGNGLTRGAWIKGIVSALDTSGDKKIDWAEFSRAVG